MEYQVDPKREKLPKTGIFVRAQKDGHWGSHDIAHLERPSLDAWLRSRDTIDWPISVVMILLNHERQS